MLTLGQKATPLGAGVLTGAVVAVGAASVAVPELLPWGFIALAGAALLLYWAVRWEITVWAWIWVLSYGLLDWPEWKLLIPGFFNMTVPRWLFLVAVAGFGLFFLMRRRRLRFDRAVLWVMLALVVYCAVSAARAGWLQDVPQRVRGAPYFRLLGPLLFPYVMFLLMYNAVDDERQIRRGLIVLSLYGWYALYVAYLQYAAIMGAESARALIWPGYVNDPGFGHHFDRARGAFPACNAQANLLLLVFFGNLFLSRRIRGPYRPALIVQALLIPPAIFFTGLRSAYLAFLLAGIIWCVWGCRARAGRIKLAIAAVVVIAGAAMFWTNLAQTRRSTGGVAQVGPIWARLILTARTWEMVKRHPVTGAGFGHFMEADRSMPRDPGTLASSPHATTNATPANLFLVMAGETGIVGLALMVAVFVLIYKLSLRLYRTISPEADGLVSRPFVVVFWIALTIYLVDATFVDPLWDVPSNGLFWSFAGLMAGLYRRLETSPAPASGGAGLIAGPAGAGPP